MITWRCQSSNKTDERIRDETGKVVWEILSDIPKSFRRWNPWCEILSISNGPRTRCSSVLKTSINAICITKDVAVWKARYLSKDFEKVLRYDTGEMPRITLGRPPTGEAKPRWKSIIINICRPVSNGYRWRADSWATWWLGYHRRIVNPLRKLSLFESEVSHHKNNSLIYQRKKEILLRKRCFVIEI